MTVTNMTMCPILNSGITTFSVLPSAQKPNEPVFNLVYISHQDGNTSQVTIKPISMKNPESFNNAKTITTTAQLAWVQLSDKGIDFGAYKTKAATLPKNGFTLLLEDKGQKINLGRVTCPISFEEPGYKYLNEVYKAYFDTVKEALKAQIAKSPVKT